MQLVLSVMTSGTMEVREAQSSEPGSAMGRINRETWLDTIQQLMKLFKLYLHFGKVELAQVCLDWPALWPQLCNRRHSQQVNSMGSSLNPSLEE